MASRLGNNMDILMFVLLLRGAWITLKISFVAILLGIFFGTIFGVLNSKRVKMIIIAPFIAFYVSAIRGTPIFIQLLIVYFALPKLFNIDISSFLAGIITLSLNSTAYLSESIRSGVNAVSVGQWEAAKSLGYSKIQTLRYIILPQALQNVLPSITNELIALIKESSILMIIGVPELTKSSKEIVAQELNPIEIYFIAAILYFLITFILTRFSIFLERRRN